MSVHDDLTSVQRCLEDLNRSVGRLEQQLGSGGLEMRRVRADADHLRESVALLREAAHTGAPGKPAGTAHSHSRTRSRNRGGSRASTSRRTSCGR